MIMANICTVCSYSSRRRQRSPLPKPSIFCHEPEPVGFMSFISPYDEIPATAIGGVEKGSTLKGGQYEHLPQLNDYQGAAGAPAGLLPAARTPSNLPPPPPVKPKPRKQTPLPPVDYDDEDGMYLHL